MKKPVLHKNVTIVLGLDVVFLTLALYTSHLIRFEFLIPLHFHVLFLKILPFVLVTKIGFFYYFDLYRGMWRYTSIFDLLNIIKASSFSSLSIILFILLRYSFIGFSRSIFLMDWFLTILFVSGVRVCIRLYFEFSTEGVQKTSISATLTSLLKRRKALSTNLLIIGAGDAGEKIYREIRDNTRLGYNVVGFLDDNTAKVGKKIHGIPVISTIRDIQTTVKRVHADEILIAIPSANAQQMRRIVEYCNASDVDYKTMPGYGELIGGRVTVQSIREVDYRDLIGREVIKLDEEKIGAYLKGQRILVTGAGGSIGAELCRQICRFQPQAIVLFERAETPLYEVELELKQRYPDIEIMPILADAQVRNQLVKAFCDHNPKIVFHAAAYKQVPMLELQPWKAIDNNILGTQNLVAISIQHNIERFVFVSTDKAVRPTNVMGATKRVSEMLVQAQNACNNANTQFMIVRFGNVVGSIGSVVPRFKKQIENGGPVTVTHSNVTRYFMTIPEASQLILQAGAMGKGGEVFILDMGTPIKIDDMARDLIRLSGFEPDEEIKIEYIGLRPGEKLYEELITDGEDIVPTDHEKIMVLKGVECDLQLLDGKIEELVHLAREQDGEKIKSKLHEIVPEYNL